MRRRTLSVTAIVFIAFVGLVIIDLAIPRHDYFLERAGTLEDRRYSSVARPGRIDDTVHLEASTGLEVDMRVVRPTTTEREQVPVVILLGGQETGKDAVDLIGEPDGMAFVALDYPHRDNRDLRGFWQSLAAVPAIQDSFLDSPPAILLATTWLLEQPWVDPGRVELAGVSLGVPFASTAGAVDQRLSRVWLLHGGGDNASWVAHIARRQIESDWLRNAVAHTALFAVYGNSFDTRRRIPQIAPRPVVIIAARDDDFVPPESQESLIRAAESDHVELIWTEGRHVGPQRADELQQLLYIVTSKITDES